MKTNEKRGMKNSIRHILAALVFCMVMSIGFICFADEQGTVLAESARIRESADPNSEQLGSVPKGKVIDIISETTGTDGQKWYQVYVDSNTKGFIRANLIRMKDGASLQQTPAPSTTSAQNTDTTPTDATAIDAKKATVVTNNVSIRKGASTNHEKIGTANRGMVVTVTGEAAGTDGKKWYQVSFMYGNEEKIGFIRSDLVTFDNVPPDTAVSQIEGIGGENPAEGQAPEETAPVDEPQEEVPSQPVVQNTFTPLEPPAEPEYIMPGFKPTPLDVDRENQITYQAYAYGTVPCILYGVYQDGEEGWYLWDREKNTYMRYPYTLPNVEVPNQKTVSMMAAIILVVIIVILVAVVGLLLIKLKGNNTYSRGYGFDDDDSNYRDDDIEDIEELEDSEEDYRPVRQPQGRRPQPQPQPGRKNPQGGRPQPQPGSGQPGQQPQGRRPQPVNGQPGQQAQGSRPQGSRPGSGQPQGRRPQPQSGSGQPQGRRPQQNEKLSPQKGHKAKRLLEDDDDMDFMDI